MALSRSMYVLGGIGTVGAGLTSDDILQRYAILTSMSNIMRDYCQGDKTKLLALVESELVNEKAQQYITENGTSFVICKPVQPEWEVNKQYDNGFAYDPNAKPRLDDYVNWTKWKILNEGAQYGGWIFDRYMPDAVKTYEHYRSGLDTNLEIDYGKAYREDKNIQLVVDQHIIETQQVVEKMIEDGQKAPFSITGGLMSVTTPYPSTENWQKAIGGHKIWISADISVDENGQIQMNTSVHEIDRYNFNRNQCDIASGAPDNENGRFEELGWAKSYNTTGEAHFDVSWKLGEAQDITIQPILSSERG